MAPPTSLYRAFPGLIPADRTNFTASLQGHAVCEAQCNASAACVGYTTDQTATNCWLYDTVHALVSSPPDAFHLKPGLPVPPHAPPPPPPPPPLPPPLAPLANAPATHLGVRVKSTGKDAKGVIAFRLTNSGDRVALFARLALRQMPSARLRRWRILEDADLPAYRGRLGNGAGRRWEHCSLWS